jgi:hypothetical protein
VIWVIAIVALVIALAALGARSAPTAGRRCRPSYSRSAVIPPPPAPTAPPSVTTTRHAFYQHGALIRCRRCPFEISDKAIAAARPVPGRFRDPELLPPAFWACPSGAARWSA